VHGVCAPLRGGHQRARGRGRGGAVRELQPIGLHRAPGRVCRGRTDSVLRARAPGRRFGPCRLRTTPRGVRGRAGGGLRIGRGEPLSRVRQERLCSASGRVRLLRPPGVYCGSRAAVRPLRHVHAARDGRAPGGSGRGGARGRDSIRGQAGVDRETILAHGSRSDPCRPGAEPRVASSDRVHASAWRLRARSCGDALGLAG